MSKTKLIISISMFIILLITTSVIKNKTRILEKDITNLNLRISSKEKSINEAQLEFDYLSSPAEIEEKLNLIGFKNYHPILFSNIFFNILDYDKYHKNISQLNLK